MNDHPDLLNEVKDLAWEELHLRYQLRSMQIGLDVNEQVKRFFVPMNKADRYWKEKTCPIGLKK